MKAVERVVVGSLRSVAIILRHVAMFFAELGRYTLATGNWWLLPFVLFLILLMAVVGLVEAAAPWAIYPIF